MVGYMKIDPGKFPTKQFNYHKNELNCGDCSVPFSE